MPIGQEDLPQLSRDHFEVAEHLSGRQRRAHMYTSGLVFDENHRLIWLPSQKGKNLYGLQIIYYLGQVDSITSPDKKVTRSNIITVARLGGFGLRQIHEIADQRHRRQTPTLLELVHKSLFSMNVNMTNALEKVMRPVTGDEAALKTLDKIARKLESAE